MRNSEDVSQVNSAWRAAGGNVYKVQFRRAVIWDRRHACSCRAVNHACELGVIVLCFVCVVGVFWLLMHDTRMKTEREQAGAGLWDLLMFMFAMTIVTVIMTVRKLLQRWHKASTDVFVSEV